MAAPVIELKSYPWPQGMAIPHLMPEQQKAWNGDHFLAAEVLRLKEAHGLTFAVETGSCLGSTTWFLSDHFDEVKTIEAHVDYHTIAASRLRDKSNATVIWGTSRVQLPCVIEGVGGRTFMFLDAHWGPNCPLLDELDIIAKSGVKPCIVIHDFFVPDHPDFGFDKMPDGRPFNLELVKDHLDAIYGEGKWTHRYPTEVAGARRGWISIEPA